MPRNCDCAGGCGPQEDGGELVVIAPLSPRRSSKAAAGWAEWVEAQGDAAELARWKRELHAPAPQRKYTSDKHTDARMHLGGIGTGNFEIGSDGQFTTWQLFNTLRDGNVPFHFVVKTDSTTRLLQTAGGPDWPRVKQIEMTGEYPFARLRFIDAEVPVELELSAFSPFAPLDAELSSVPAAAFVFRVHNPGKVAQVVSLAALMQNPVGYEADGENISLAHDCFGGNINEVLSEEGVHGLLMRAASAQEPTLDRSVTIYTLANLKNLNSPPPDRPANLTVKVFDDSNLALDKVSEPSGTVIWLEDAVATQTPAFLTTVRDLVKAGATLLFAGSSQPLLKAYASWTGGRSVADSAVRPDIVFEDFE